MSATPGSPNISTLDFNVEFDISTATPTIKLTNNSTGSNLAACTWWVVISSPSSTPLHTGSFGSHDMSGAWTTWTMPETWPQPFNEIEWSGYPYDITLYVSDGATPTPNVYNLMKSGSICRPNGNTRDSQNNFGVGSLISKVQCSTAKLFVQDNTKYLYKNSTGTVKSQTWTLFYPPDSNGFASPKAVVTGIPYVYFDLTYNADGYVVMLETVVTYDLGNGCSVDIAYKAQKKLNINCNMDLCPLICCYQELISRVQHNKCEGQDSEAFKNKLIVISGKVNIVLMSQSQGCDVDIDELLADIKKLAGCDCGCTQGAGSGVFPIPITPATGNCCPITLPVYLQGTTTPPTECPNSFFPASIFAPDGVTWIGMAYSADDMISIMNANAAWAALGTATPMGNCQVAFVKNPNAGPVPPVQVIGGIGSGSGSTGTGTGGTSTSCVNGNQKYLAVLTDKCSGAAITVLPTNAQVNYGSGPNYSLGNVTSMIALLNALNTEAHKPVSVSYSIGTMPGGILSILVSNNGCPGYAGPISIFGDNSCSGIAPITLPVYIHNTTTPPVECPGSFFPASVFAPDDTTFIGMAYSAADMIALMNANGAWSVLGTASPLGNCQVSFVKNPGMGSVPPVHVIGGIGTGIGTTTTGTGSTSKGCVNGVQQYLAVLTDKCNGTAITTFPTNAYVNYGSGPNVSLGAVASMAALLAALNADGGKPGTVTYSIGALPGFNSILVKNTGCPGYSGPISIFGDNSCTIVVGVIDVTTGIAPAACPGSYFPVTVYAPDGVTAIGNATDIYSMLSLINGNVNWQALGVASFLTLCSVLFTPATGVTVIPTVKVKSSTSTACVNSQQNYVVSLKDPCSTNTVLTSASFPVNATVDFGLGAGPIALGLVANWAALITALNATPSKPASVTFSLGSVPDTVNIFNGNCAAYTGVVTIQGTGIATSFLLYGANHSSLTATAPTQNGQVGIGLRSNTDLGRIPGSTANKHMWHTILLNNSMIVAEGDTGKVYFYDVSSPLNPVLYATVQLNDTGSGNCFTGNPHTATTQSAPTAVPSYYSLYFPTDYQQMPIDGIVVCEATTGSIWKINQYGVIASFHHVNLLGQCPRVLVNNLLYFTDDGDLRILGSLANPLLEGVIPVMDVNDLTNTGMSTQTIFLNGTEGAWAASYDGASTIYFTGVATSVATFDVPSQTVTNRYANVIGNLFSLGATLLYQGRVNTVYFQGKLYIAPHKLNVVPGIPLAIDVSSLGGVLVVHYFDITSLPAGTTSAFSYNVKPLGNCYVVVTQFKVPNSGVGYLRLFSLTGGYVASITITQGQVYNVVPIPGVSVYLPNSLV